MRFTSPLRLPLQTGGTALTTVLFTFILIPFYWGVWPFIVVFLMARDASRRRASDIVFSPEGLSVRGGPHDGYSETWKGVRPQSAAVSVTNETFYKSGDAPTIYIQQLTLDGVELARGGEADEVASFRAVAALVAEAAGGAVSPVAVASNVPMCPACGAPLVPSSDESTRCPYCSTVVAVPPEVRDAVKIAHDVQRGKSQTNAHVRSALTGGHAGVVNQLVFACGVSGHVAAPLALFAVIEHRLSLAFVPLAVPVLLAAFARIAIAKRVAVRSLAFGCAAIAPTDPSHPPKCHRCRGPLAVVDAADAIATCAYCGATNVLGLDVGSAAASLDVDDIDEIVARHRATVLKSWAVVALGVSVCVAGFFYAQ